MSTNKTEQELVKVSEIPSLPTITGSVRVSLHELDKMRAEHAKAVKLATHLQEVQSEVTIIVKRWNEVSIPQSDGYYDRKGTFIETDRRLVSDKKLVEVSREYRNLDEVKDSIKQEVEAKVDTEIKNLENEVSMWRQKYHEITEEKQRLIDTRVELSARVKYLENQIRTDENTIIACTKKIEEESEELRQANETHKKLLETIEELKKQKSVWYWLQQSFTVKNAKTSM